MKITNALLHIILSATFATMLLSIMLDTGIITNESIIQASWVGLFALFFILMVAMTQQRNN